MFSAKKHVHEIWTISTVNSETQTYKILTHSRIQPSYETLSKIACPTSQHNEKSRPTHCPSPTWLRSYYSHCLVSLTALRVISSPTEQVWTNIHWVPSHHPSVDTSIGFDYSVVSDGFLVGFARRCERLYKACPLSLNLVQHYIEMGACKGTAVDFSKLSLT